MSPQINHFAMELESEINSQQSGPVSGPPNIDNVLAELGHLTQESLLLGVALDGLPVLLNMNNSSPGPLLIIGDAGTGKTNFLFSIVQMLIRMHLPATLQYTVVTHNSDEWKNVERTSHQVGIHYAEESEAYKLLNDLVSRAHLNGNPHTANILLIDDLETMARHDLDSLQDFRWLLARGPSRKIWPIVTMDAQRYGQVISWVPIFRTRIFSRIQDAKIAYALGGDKDSGLSDLEAPNQFSLRENGKWIRFWLPGF